jgi:hypothetical protein
MSSASQAQRVSTDPSDSAASKQRLYLVAFASFGLLIAVQFRHLFGPAPVNAEPASVPQASQPSGDTIQPKPPAP